MGQQQRIHFVTRWRANPENSAPIDSANSRRSIGSNAGALPINSCGIFVIGRTRCGTQLAVPACANNTSGASQTAVSSSTQCSAPTEARGLNANARRLRLFLTLSPTLSQIWNKRQKIDFKKIIQARRHREAHPW
ncbi:MAG: hypothetical protein LQ340_000935 [Diploschistes diacapsis]|nr:MAG: hypothetical protein LQ340_000935 [Diploschistes diacapsis]